MAKKMGSRDLNSADFQKSSDADIQAVIAKGKGKMPGYEGKISNDDIAAVVKYRPHAEEVVADRLPEARVGAESEDNCETESILLVDGGDPAGGDGAGKCRAKEKAIKNEECLLCHSEPSMTKDENGKQVSLHVDEAKFKGSIHSMFNCVDCHTEISGAPHDPASTKPQCATCHADEQTKYDHGLHAKAIKAGDGKAAQCQDCHGSVHELLPASDPASRGQPA